MYRLFSWKFISTSKLLEVWTFKVRSGGGYVPPPSRDLSGEREVYCAPALSCAERMNGRAAAGAIKRTPIARNTHSTIEPSGAAAPTKSSNPLLELPRGTNLCDTDPVGVRIRRIVFCFLRYSFIWANISLTGYDGNTSIKGIKVNSDHGEVYYAYA